MKLEIKEMDLFTAPEKYKMAHCLSADLRLNMGIVVQMNRTYDLKTKLKAVAPVRPVKWPDCILTGSVFNLITKETYKSKPTLDTLTEALCVMRRIVEQEGIRYIAMPKIGCGLDKLQWEDVERRIRQVFDDVQDLEILVCVLPAAAKKPHAKTKSEPK